MRVRPDGRVGLPMLGVFYAQGKDTDQLEEEIIFAFMAATAATRQPQVLIEVVERRPFYAAGLVNKPGPYPFVPQMTVLHAVTIAGGVLRSATANSGVTQLVNVSREITRVRQAEASLKRLIPRFARLTAERDGTASPEVPKLLIDLAGAAEAKELMGAEIGLMQHRREALEGRKRRFANSIARVRQEVRKLEGRMLPDQGTGAPQPTSG